MSFANPYNFVKIDNGVERSNIHNTVFHNKIQENTYTGVLKCTLKTLTKIFTPSTLPEDIEEKNIGKDKNGRPRIHYMFKSFYYLKKDKQKQYAIPGSSLKGVIRSVAEAISNSCMHVFDGKYKNISYKNSDALHKDSCIFIGEHGNLAEGVCICCSMFGMANAKDTKKAPESENKLLPNAFKGKMSFSDALLQSTPSFETIFSLKELSSPKPYHKTFYADRQTIKGRKFYYHHSDHDVKDLKGEETHRNRSVIPLKKDALFEFTISYENLTEEEYGLLLTTLELESGLAHKIGMGKPLGLGSCEIVVTEIREFSKNRYLSISNASACKLFSNDALKERKETIKGLWENGIPNDLKCILRLNNGFTVIRYPKKDTRDQSNDEFTIYKNLHPPCSSFSDDEKTGEGIVAFHTPQIKPEKSHRKKPSHAVGSLADVFKEAIKNKK